MILTLFKYSGLTLEEIKEVVKISDEEWKCFIALFKEFFIFY
jgi:hypothetical protein